MTEVRDYDEMVSLCAIKWFDDFPKHDKVATLPFREAIRIVIEDWDNDKQKQLRPIIMPQTGELVESVDEIRDLYKQIKASSGL